MVGRDIGTVVLPDADLKIYLDAVPEERSRRRYQEMVARGQPADYEQVLASLRRRDAYDSGREAAPLRPAEDALILDSTDMTIEQVLERAMALVVDWSRSSLSRLVGQSCSSPDYSTTRTVRPTDYATKRPI